MFAPKFTIERSHFLSPLADAIREEISNIVDPEHTNLIDGIMKSHALQKIYVRLEAENRMPTEIEWEAIRRVIQSLYGGYISNDIKRKAAQKTLFPLIKKFYSSSNNHSIRIGCFINELQNALDKASTDIKEKFKEIILTTARTLKKYCEPILPSEALKIGRNGQKDRETVQVFLKNNLI